MSYYKCGHNRGMVFIKHNTVEYSAYLVWKESRGFEGDKTQCWKCFCKELIKTKLKLE